MLQALELSGFKSFADRTRFAIPAGVTVVVGPNGSGKSNVVDAIKWVLGSQSPKALRGAEMTDVIFSGSGSRKPLNAAEVSLTFDNSSRAFTLDAAEVRITRRVYRSGDGEYLINGQACRLRDIKELLAGTGIGGDGYSVIEQGRVDALLQSTPQHRRTIFEEAAGISRYRLKKQEAAKRLERVEQNLLRLSDIVEEVDGRLRRVRSQAGKAQQYREQTTRLRELRAQLGLLDYRTLSQQIEHCGQQLAQLSVQEAERAAQLAERQQGLTEQEASFKLSATRVNELQQRLSELRERIATDRANATATVARIEDLQAERQRLAHACEQLAAPADVAESADQFAKSAQEVAEAELAKATQNLAEQLAQLDSLETAEDAARLAYENSLAQRQAAEAELAEQTARRKRLADELAELEKRRKQIEQRLAAAETRAATSAQEVTASQTEEQSYLTEVEQQLAALTAAQQRQELARRDYAATHRQLATLETELVSLKHRAEALDELEQRLETLGSDMRRLASTSTDPPNLLGLVADLLHVDADAAPLVEAALGEKAHQLVVEHGGDLVDSLTAHPDAFSTRASFQRLDLAVPAIALDRLDLSSESGVIGRADHFVECDELHAPLVRRLLGRTWFVDNLQTAWQLQQSLGRGLSFVTMAAEVLSADGTLIAGPKEDLSGLFSRRAESERLRRSISDGEIQVVHYRRRAEELEHTSSAGAAQVTSLTAQHAAVAENLARVRQQIAALAERTTHSERESTQLRHDRAEVLAAITTRQNEQAGVEVALAELTDRSAGQGDPVAKPQAAYEAAKKAVAGAQAAVTECRVALAKAEQQCHMLAERNDAQERASAAELARRHATERLTECEAKLAELVPQFAALQQSLQSLTPKREQLETELQLAQQSDSTSRAAWGELNSALAALRAEVDAMRKRRQDLELRLHQAKLERQTLAERLRQEHEIDLAALASTPLSIKQAAEPFDRSAAEHELETLRRELQTLGPVNSEALEELTELETRFNELAAQYKDLAEAKAALERLTQRINADSRDVFLATVEEIRGHFRDLYRRLFGGGEADLILLEDPSGDVLECGIDIAACPPGKELKSISLLSGGEKTLTCVALLLALFRSKPSPFCVLDEVDAALDEANIGRFTSVLSEFLSSTQFIVITHSKKTMTGANTLYGVTMQESGISKQVAVKFEDVSEEGEIDPRALVQAPTEQSKAA